MELQRIILYDHCHFDQGRSPRGEISDKQDVRQRDLSAVSHREPFGRVSSATPPRATSATASARNDNEGVVPILALVPVVFDTQKIRPAAKHAAGL